jgi:stage II sporulation protein D
VCCLLLWVSGCATRAPERPAGRAPAPRGPSVRREPLPSTPRREAPGAAASPVTRETDRSPVLRVEVGGRGSGLVEAIPLEAYVRDVLVGELSVAAGDGALAGPAYEVQAIVARSYALAVRGRHRADGFDLCSTTHCQVYARDRWRQSRWAGQIAAAVDRSRGRFLAHDGRPIEAVFHAHCGGHTSTAAEVWRSPGAPYLQGVPDAFCVREQAGQWTATHDLSLVRVALARTRRTDVGERLDGVQVLRRDAGGRAVEMVLTGDRAPVVSAEDFRLALLAAAGPRSLRSARFDVRRDGAQVVFSGVGAGHGVGLCQIGMIGRLRAGQSADDILRTYYTGIEIASLGGT